jgi:hypothetical protein
MSLFISICSFLWLLKTISYSSWLVSSGLYPHNHAGSPHCAAAWAPRHCPLYADNFCPNVLSITLSNVNGHGEFVTVEVLFYRNPNQRKMRPFLLRFKVYSIYYVSSLNHTIHTHTHTHTYIHTYIHKIHYLYNNLTLYTGHDSSNSYKLQGKRLDTGRVNMSLCWTKYRPTKPYPLLN